MDPDVIFPLAVLVLWFAIGATVGLIEARRGHWHKGWAVLAVFGPFAISLAAHARHREAEAGPILLEAGERRAEGLDVLVGFDGSPESLNAATTIVELLGTRLGHLTIASVLDFDTATAASDGPFVPARGWPERREAEEALQLAADELGQRLGLRPATVLLAGDPAAALETYASEQDHDVVTTGTRGRGMTKVVFGSCASRIGRRGGVPVLLVPTPAQGSTTAAGP